MMYDVALDKKRWRCKTSLFQPHFSFDIAVNIQQLVDPFLL